VNITFAFDEQLIAAAKLVAARHDTSISALVRTSLEHQVALDVESASAGASGVLQELIDYSMGRRPRAVTMDTLGIDDYGVLLRLLNAANLPHPLIPLAKRQAMAANMAKAINANEARPKRP
jgi:3-hydroxyisobutyrate dehydrogenase-like beta-hydroxyacid dehydrogenase